MKSQTLTKRLLAFCFWVAFWPASWVYALPHRTVSLDFTFGVPQVAAATGTVLLWKRLQVGLGYTFIPPNPAFGEPIELEEQTIEFADGLEYSTKPVVTPSVSMIAPFVRFFPGASNFYLHLSYTFIQASAKIEGSFKTDTGIGIPVSLGGALMTGNIRVRQFLPTVGVGHIWTLEHIFINVTLGATFFANIATKSNLEVVLPEEVGGLIGNTGVLEELNAELSTQLKDLASEAVTDLRKRYPVLPSIQIAFGFFF